MELRDIQSQWNIYSKKESFLSKEDINLILRRRIEKNTKTFQGILNKDLIVASLIFIGFIGFFLISDLKYAGSSIAGLSVFFILLFFQYHLLQLELTKVKGPMPLEKALQSVIEKIKLYRTSYSIGLFSLIPVFYALLLLSNGFQILQLELTQLILIGLICLLLGYLVSRIGKRLFNKLYGSLEEDFKLIAEELRSN